MPVLHSFLLTYSLRTGATVALALSSVFLFIFLILGFLNPKDVFSARVIVLYLMWFCFTMLGFYGVYVQISTFIIPELSRRILFIILDIMGVIASYFKDKTNDDMPMPLPDIGLQWYTIASANESLYYVFIALFVLTIPIKAYLFIILLSYYIVVKREHGTFSES